MTKDIAERNEALTTANTRQMAALRLAFPACFRADGSFDLGRFQEAIAPHTSVANEGYELRFLGKGYARLLASTDTTTIIQPDDAHNALPENRDSGNIYISGDNLDGLKHLLKSYYGAIKCIYIDPPYNTGSDGFVYADRFGYTRQSLVEKLSIGEEEADRILDLTRRGSASHSAWLTFMYCRLLLARDLLTEDGAIFISIDDNEQANLKLLCDDVFGEENFVGQIVWQTATDNNPTQLATEHEYVLVYVKNVTEQDYWEIPSEKGKLIQAKYEELKAELGEDIDLIQTHLRKWIRKQINGDDLSGVAHYSYVDAKGVYYPGNSSNTKPGGYTFDIIHPDTKEVCAKPDYGYRFKKETFDKADEIGDVMWGNDETIIPKIKKRLDTTMQKLKSIYYEDNRATTSDLKTLMGGKGVFNNPKSVNFLKHVIRFVTNNDDTILDFFSGSGTTADAVMQLNAEDGGNRKFIAIQIAATLSPDEKSEKPAYQFLQSANLPTTLDYIGMERIRRAAAKLAAAHPGKALDLGFRHYTLAEPNPNTLDKLDTFDPAALLPDTTILEDFGLPTILATWLAADGYGLAAAATPTPLAGYTAYHQGAHLYLIHPGFSIDSMKALIARYEDGSGFQPQNIVLFGYSFPGWSTSEMIEKNLRVLNDADRNLKINYAVRY